MSVDWQIVKTIVWSYFKAHGPVRTSQIYACVRGKEPSKANLIPTLFFYPFLIFQVGWASFSIGRVIASSHTPTTYLSGLLNLAFLFVFIIALLSFGPAMAASSPLTSGDTETLMASPVNEETLLVSKVFTFLTISNPYAIPAFIGAFIGLTLSGIASPIILLMGPLLYHLVILTASWISSSTNLYLLKHCSRRAVKAFWISIFAVILVAVLSTVLRIGLDIGSILRMLSYSTGKWWLLLLPSTYAAQAVIYSCTDIQMLPFVMYGIVLLAVFSLSWLLALRSVRGIFFKTISETYIGGMEMKRTFGYAALKEVSLPKVFESMLERLLSEGARIAIFFEKRFSFRGVQFLGRIILPVFLYFIFLSVLRSVPPLLGPFRMLLLMGVASFEVILLGMSSATAISQEGKNIWVVLSSPVRLEEYLVGKCYLYLLVNSLIQFVMTLITAFLIKLPLLEALLLSLASVFWVGAITGVGQWIGAKYATFESFEMNIASQSIQMGGALSITGGILFFLMSSLILGANLLLPASIIIFTQDTLTALSVGLPYSIIINLAFFNFFIGRAGRTLAKREYLVTS